MGRLFSCKRAVLLGVLTFLGGAFLSAGAQNIALDIRPGDRICIIGNTLADRMQHDGWLETFLYSRFPKHNLVTRNLGFSGDELTLRIRSASFGTPNQWLTFNKADVIFAFFGYNESFAGPAGLDKFKKDLDGVVKDMLSNNYNGKSPPRLVLFSPIAHEDLRDPNLPDGKENNARLALYTDAIAEVARNHKIPFVDLFRPTQGLYTQTSKLTINGVHLTEAGNKALAQIIDKALFAKQAEPKRNPTDIEKLRQAILDRNFHWYNRYRTVDGYSIYGGRADLRFTAGQTNRDVMKVEMEVLDVMTANRDKRVWAVAQGRDLKVDDANTPAFVPVVSNKPGPLPGGKHIFLSGEEQIQTMTAHKGMKVNLFASEKEFPELTNLVQMSFDTKGRLWVATWPTYPHWKPKEPMNDKLLILEDTDGDGKADKCTTFADGLHCPTGFEFWNGGVILAHAPELMFLKDVNGDDKADIRERILHGIDSADTHHTANSFVFDGGGALYFQEGTFHHTQVETPWGPTVRNANAAVFRYEPRNHKFDVYVNYGFANPHGHTFDRWGQDIVVDGTGANPFHAALFSGHMPYPQRHGRPPQVYQQKTRPCPGMETLSSRHFPKEMQGNLLVPNVIGFHGILRYKVVDKGSSFEGIEQEPILSSTDQNFRPSDVRVGPDGAIYFIDWHNPIIGHMQHNLRDPNRDREHGRIYRVTYENSPLLKPVKIHGEPIDKLLDVLKEPEDRVRYRARIELGGRATKDVMATLKTWIAKLNPKDADYEHHMLEALWLHQNHNVVNEELLKRMLTSPEFRARAAATRVLCYWRDRVPDSLDLLKKQAADPHPRVRLEAVRAASFYTDPAAVEVVLISAEKPSDQYLDFTRGETMKVLDPHVKRAIAEGRTIPFTSTAGARFFLKNVGIDELLKMKRTRPVYMELLTRKGVRDEQRREAAAGLAKLENKTEVAILLEMIRAQDEISGAEDSVAFDLVRVLTTRPMSELSAIRGELEKLASQGSTPVTRQLGYVALVAADGGPEKAWQQSQKSMSSLADFVKAMPLLRDPAHRADLYPKVKELLSKDLSGKAPPGTTTLGRYVRIELPGKVKTLTLAEVEVFSGGRNVALQGKASQQSTLGNNTADKAIDGNTSGNYNDGSLAHLKEGQNNPWWEVDLGGEYSLQTIVIHNRSDGALGKRLNGYTLKVLDKDRKVVFQRTKLPTPEPKAPFEVGSESPAVIVRRAAMTALISVRGQEEATFKELARFVSKDEDRHAAIQAMTRIPVNLWPKDEAKPLLDRVLTYVRKVPVKERTSAAVLDAMQFADTLASLFPLAEARIIRKELGELGVRVIRIGALPDQMLFDRERIVVRAGKPVEVVFENTDIMPHNIVFTVPGALEEIGLQAEASATMPGAIERHYVPASKKILHSSRLLQPRDSQKLSFTAPKAPGVYPYVCTYPGHWRRMYGAMYVVEDLDEYMSDPEKYLAKHPLPIADELLKFTRPRTEWKFEDLISSVAQLDHGRSFSNGKQMFTVANCLACHKMNGVGTELAADLTKIDAKQLTPVEILRDILEPSFRINEKFQSYSIETNQGKVYTGLVIEETPQMLKLIENPLAKTQAVTIKISDIAERKKLPTSIMPKGLLDKLGREEILDLVAYIVSRGDSRHAIFQGGHDHGHKKH